MRTMEELKLARRAFVLSGALLVFGYGVVVGHGEVFPFDVLNGGWTSLQRVARERGTLFGTRPSEFLAPARYAGSGVTVWKAGEAAPGLTLLTGYFDDGNQLRLVRLDGSVVHKWPVRYFDLFPDPDHIEPADDRPKGNWNAAIHGAHLLADGSVVFNFTYKGTARLDRCGNRQWTLERMTHHSVNESADGAFWIPGARYVSRNSPFANLRPPYVEDTILRVSPRGEVLTEISMVDVLFRNNLQGLLFWKRATGDFTHVNDVEELTPALAGRFPMFAPGDLLVSLRMQHMILVLDPRSLVVKWMQAGPWIAQHDPDFLPNGRILVFNNNDDGTETGSLFGGSNILEVDPATHASGFRYGGGSESRMFTDGRGKQQAIGDHLLVTEADAGRAFEIDANGNIVWEYVNRYDASSAALITEATRYPEQYFTVRDWTCR